MFVDENKQFLWPNKLSFFSVIFELMADEVSRASIAGDTTYITSY